MTPGRAAGGLQSGGGAGSPFRPVDQRDLSAFLDHPGREGQVRTESSAVGEHRTHRTMAPMDADEVEDPAFEARVIRSFIREGRLTTIPARERRRQVIYRYLRDQVFTEDRATMIVAESIGRRLTAYTVTDDAAGNRTTVTREVSARFRLPSTSRTFMDSSSPLSSILRMP